MFLELPVYRNGKYLIEEGKWPHRGRKGDVRSYSAWLSTFLTLLCVWIQVHWRVCAFMWLMCKQLCWLDWSWRSLLNILLLVTTEHTETGETLCLVFSQMCFSLLSLSFIALVKSLRLHSWWDHAFLVLLSSRHLARRQLKTRQSKIEKIQLALSHHGAEWPLCAAVHGV